MRLDQFKKEVLIHKDIMFRLAWRILSDEENAKDVVQDSFLKLWDQRKSLKKVQNLRAYCLSSVRNKCIDNMRKLKAETNKDYEIQQQSDDINPELILEQRDELKRANRIIDSLNESQKEIIQLREIEGMEFDEIALATGLSKNNVRVILSRARKEIKEQMQKQF